MFFRVEPAKIDLKLLLGLLVGVLILYQVAPSEKKEAAHFENLALGKETTVSFGVVDGMAVHCQDLTDLDDCLLGYEEEGNQRPVMLWLGNSQIHSINQYQLGEETAAPELHRRFQAQGDYFLTLSQPNANLQEHYLLFAYLLNRLPVETLVLPVVFDDMREDGIRTNLVHAFKDSSAIDLVSRTAIGQSLIANHGDQDAAGNDMAALEDTVQKRSEKTLNAALKVAWPLWAERPALRGSFLISLYQFRNWALGINPSSTRRMIPGRYAKNRDAFLAILDLAAMREVKVLVYMVPLRNDVKVPYEPDEYVAFKSEVEKIAEQSNARYVDLENLIPSDLWGTKDATTLGGGSELDFMHFQAGGHHLLAEALYRELSILRTIP